MIVGVPSAESLSCPNLPSAGKVVRRDIRRSRSAPTQVSFGMSVLAREGRSKAASAPVTLSELLPRHAWNPNLRVAADVAEPAEDAGSCRGCWSLLSRHRQLLELMAWSRKVNPAFCPHSVKLVRVVVADGFGGG